MSETVDVNAGEGQDTANGPYPWGRTPPDVRVTRLAQKIDQMNERRDLRARELREEIARIDLEIKEARKAKLEAEAIRDRVAMEMKAMAVSQLVLQAMRKSDAPNILENKAKLDALAQILGLDPGAVESVFKGSPIKAAKQHRQPRQPKNGPRGHKPVVVDEPAPDVVEVLQEAEVDAA